MCLQLRRLLSKTVKGAAWFLLTAYSKMKEEGGELKKELLSKKEPELEDLEYSQSTRFTKYEKACSEENTEGMAKQPFERKISRDQNHKFIRLPQQKPGIEMGFYQQKHCQLRRLRQDEMKEGCQTSQILQDGTIELLRFYKMGPSSYLVANVHYSLRKGKNDSKGHSEIIRAASTASKSGTITLVSTGHTASN